MRGRAQFFLDAIRKENGQVIVWVAFLMILFIGVAGLTLDVGVAYGNFRQLQTSSDAAALAAAYALSQPGSTATLVKAAATKLSSASTGLNANKSLSGVTVSTTLECLSTIGIPCSATPTGNNAVQVTQTATIPTVFIRVLSMLGANPAKSLTLSATATATSKGATNSQYNVAIVVDTTASMGTFDPNCGDTRINCALAGVQNLLKGLSPCTASSTSSSCTPFDQVSLFTFPNVQANTAKNDFTCPTSDPTILPYSTPTPGASWTAPTGSSATYQITNYLSDYSSTNKQGGSLSTSSQLSIASGASGKSQCGGLETPGGAGTYYAGAVYAALSSLAAAKAANPGSQNALIILSDGDANTTTMSGTLTTSGVYPSLKNQCQQAITAANSAPADTDVYSIAYGAASSGCSTDTSGSLAGLSPCTTMEKMASSPENFFSDATASQNKGQCVSSSNPNLNLSGIFSQLTTQFGTNPRLIPNGTK